jgi:CTD kinase subunit gamma
VVPDTRDGVLNLKSARAMLSSWRSRRVLDTSVVECALAHLDARTFAKGEKDGKDGKEEDGKESKEERSKMSRADILSRIEQDRERHKRLRERIWILPIPPLRAPAAPAGSAPSPASTSPFTPASPAPHASTSSASAAKLMPPPTASTSAPRPPAVSPLDVEFEQMWETMSDFGDDDAEGMRESVRAAGLELAA